MSNFNWIGFTALRYLMTKRKEKGHVAFILSIIGISLGIILLITVLSVMNGYQQGYITNINEIKSYHLRINAGETPLTPEELEKITTIKGLRSVTAISETQTVIQSRWANRPEGVFVRGIESSALWNDEELNKHLNLKEGDFNLEEPQSIILGNLLAQKLGADLGDKVFLQSLTIDKNGRISPEVIAYRVTGIFHSGYDDINLHMVFINLFESYKTLDLKENIYGVKLDNHFRDKKIGKKIEKILEGRNTSGKIKTVISWRDYNKSFFGALLSEKIMMIIVVSLGFIVVAVNLYQSLKRSVVERVEEIALIKAVGGSPFRVQLIFILEGVIISILGGIFGTAGGLLLVFNINSIFDLADKIIFFFISLSSGGPFSLYSGSSFFFVDFPVKVMPTDIFLVIGIACISAIGAAFLASFKLSQIKPAEVIHYE